MAGRGPDVMLYAASTEPANLAMRGALLALDGLPGFDAPGQTEPGVARNQTRQHVAFPGKPVRHGGLHDFPMVQHGGADFIASRPAAPRLIAFDKAGKITSRHFRHRREGRKQGFGVRKFVAKDIPYGEHLQPRHVRAIGKRLSGKAQV